MTNQQSGTTSARRPTDGDTLSLRLSPGTRPRLEEYARSRARSINGQLQYILDWWLEEAEAGRDPHP